MATVTLTQRGQIAKFKKLQREHPAEVDYIENADGSICGHFPVAWLRIYAPRKMSEAQKEQAVKNLRKTACAQGKNEVDF